MTCVIGLEADGVVWLGGDSAVTAGNLRSICREPKVVVASGIAIGIAGNGRETDLALSWKPPTPPKDHIRRWLIRKFVPALWAEFADANIKRKEVELELLVGIGGELFAIDERGGVASNADGYEAIGVPEGAAAARGNLRATGDRPPEERLAMALDAAREACWLIAEPYRYVNT